MNDNEAKFLFRAYRPDGSDARDPIFAAALEQAKKNPALRTWLDREVAFDRSVAAKLREIQPSAGLREAILAGGRASRRRRVWWQNPAWLALAASVVIALTVALTVRHAGPSAHNFAEFALNELATAGNQHGAASPENAKLQARLSTAALPLPGNVRLDPEELRRAGCHTVNFAGHEVFEICFAREGKMLHLYAARADDLAAGAAIARTELMTKGRFAATAWKDARFAYALVTADGTETLRRLI